jgi:branched-chain amino acid transport system permease protein
MRAGFGLVVLVAALVIPMALSGVATGQYVLNILIYALLFAYLATAWNILGGFGGQHSIGHSLFLGIGAYTTTMLYVHLGISPWLGLFVGAGLAALAAFAISGSSFRWGLRGAYFALVTLALAEAARILVINLEFLGGSGGIEIPLPTSSSTALLNLRFENNTPYYYLILALLLAEVAFTVWLRRQPFGYRLVASRENEDAAESLGVNVWRTRVLAAVVSAAMTAVGGTFLAQYIGYVHPGNFFGEIPSIQILLFAIAGGIGTIWGPTLGALALIPIAELARLQLSGVVAGAPLLIYGLALVLTMMFLPGGLMGLLSRLQRPARGARTPAGEGGRDAA